MFFLRSVSQAHGRVSIDTEQLRRYFTRHDGLRPLCLDAVIVRMLRFPHAHTARTACPLMTFELSSFASRCHNISSISKYSLYCFLCLISL
jgi:hypothetical protein